MALKPNVRLPLPRTRPSRHRRSRQVLNDISQEQTATTDTRPSGPPSQPYLILEPFTRLLEVFRLAETGKSLSSQM